MIPVPKVQRVEPRCYQCGEPDAAWTDGISKATRLLIQGDGPAICRTCIRVCIRLADETIAARDHDDRMREGWRP